MRRRAFLALPVLANAAQSQQLYSRLLKAVRAVEPVDTHEHLLPEPDRLKQNVDFFTLASHYVIHDTVSAGLLPEERKVVESQ
ncbi:MAG TPA: hypothetical protein VES20_15225, partial [Bryobacteraceae bacterium]|nr:hypothetical protein [Bryobacteraceae bacterium]